MSLDLEDWLLMGLRDVGACPDAVLKTLGGGIKRNANHKKIIHGVGIRMSHQPGDTIYEGDPVAHLQCFICTQLPLLWCGLVRCGVRNLMKT